MGGLIGMGIAGTPKLPLPVPVRRLVLNDVGPVIQWAALQRIGTYLGKTGAFDSVQQAADAMAAISQGFGPHTPAQWLALSQPMVRPLPEGGWTLHYDPAIATPFAKLDEAAAAAGQAALWQAYDAITARTLLLRGAGVRPAVAAPPAQDDAGRGPRPQADRIPGGGPRAHPHRTRPGGRGVRLPPGAGIREPMKSHTAEQGDVAVAVPDLVAAAEQSLPQQANAWRAPAAFAEPLIAGETLERARTRSCHADAVAAILKTMGGSEAMQAAELPRLRLRAPEQARRR
jgi:hypothetical protein